MEKYILSCIHNEIPALLGSLEDCGGMLYSEAYKYEFDGIVDSIYNFVQNDYCLDELELAICIKVLFVQCLHDSVPMERDVYLRLARAITTSPAKL